MPGLHADLEKHMFIPLAGSTLLAVVGGALLVVLAEKPALLPHPHGLFLLLAILCVCIAYVGLVVAPRWYRHSSKIVTWAAPTHGRIVLQRRSDSGAASLYAELVEHAGPKHKYLVLAPAWPVKPLLDAPLDAAIYRDPRTRSPVAFRIPQGLLWCVVYSAPNASVT